MVSLDQLANNANDGQAALPPSKNLYDEYMKVVPSLARKIETELPSSDDVRNSLALTFENIYTSAGGGASGMKAEDTFQRALNDQLKSDGSALHIDTVHSSMLLHFKQNAYSITDSSGQVNASGIIAPERVGSESNSQSPTSDVSPKTGRDGYSDSPNDASKSRTESTPNADGAPQFPDKKTEQIYNRAAEDAALAVMNKTLSDDQKAQAVLGAMNKAGVHNGVDLDNFDSILGQKLGKYAQVEGVRTQALFASQFRGLVKINTGTGETLDVPFNTNIKGELVGPRKH